MKKLCRVCGTSKPLDLFHKQTKSLDGRQSRCKTCACSLTQAWHKTNRAAVLLRKKEYFKKNKKHIGLKSRVWVAAHPERALEYGRKYRAANLDKERARSAKYRATHAEEGRRYYAEYHARNPGLRNAWDARRRAQEIRATPAWANEFFIEEIYDLCARRTRATGIEWHVDHIIPLQSKLVCGLHVERNLQVIPATTNRKKSNRFSPTAFQTPLPGRFSF